MTLVNKIKNTIIPTTLIAAGAYLSTGCGPSAKYLEEQRIRADSIRISDSLRMADTLRMFREYIRSLNASENGNDTVQAQNPIIQDSNAYKSPIISKNQKVIDVARVIGLNPANIHLMYDSNTLAANDFDYQMVTFNVWTNSSQKETTSLATKQTLPIVPGASYKVFYHQVKPGRVLTESALYVYSIIKTEHEKSNRTKNEVDYNRKLPGIDGVIDSLKLIK